SCCRRSKTPDMAKCLVKARPREVPQLSTSTPGAGGLHAIFLPLGLGGRRVGYERHQPHRLKRTSGWMPLMPNYVHLKRTVFELQTPSQTSCSLGWEYG